MTAIMSITKGGYEISKTIGKIFESADIYTSNPDRKEDRELIFPLKKFTKELFERYDNLIFIMAVGITVRVIAPYIKDKRKDPAVVSIDEKGNYVISILSGHLGGANRLTEKIAKEIKALPIITTASDVLKTKSVDMIAIDEGLEINNMNKAKKITSIIVNGSKVGVLSRVNLKETLPEEYILYNSLEILEEDFREKLIRGALIIDIYKSKISENIPAAYLIPKKTVLGIGCRKGKSEEEILKFINENLKKLEIFEKSVKTISSAWIKKNETGIIQVAEKLKADVKFFNKCQILDVQDKFENSEFVMKTIGVANVADSCGYLASNS
ncbi:MAG: cobalt-precorrin 5A hydrolase, partial [Bacillota bacterium]|nr:cobalt-precorrin 5A hydrolase [Bacillota bacterium]